MTINVAYKPAIYEIPVHLGIDRRIEIEEALIFDYHCDKSDVFELTTNELLAWYSELKKWRLGNGN